MPAADAPGNSYFNSALAVLRIFSERTIGLLRGSLQSLKEFRIKMKTQADLSRCFEHIASCIVLHNMLIRNVGADSEYFEESLIELKECLSDVKTPLSESTALREQFRVKIKSICLNKLGFPDQQQYSGENELSEPCI